MTLHRSDAEVTLEVQHYLLEIPRITRECIGIDAVLLTIIYEVRHFSVTSGHSLGHTTNIVL